MEALIILFILTLPLTMPLFLISAGYCFGFVMGILGSLAK